jgi:hypothetical protein
LTIQGLLSDEGKKVWGDVFPSGVIPLRSLSAGKIETVTDGSLRAYFVDWLSLSREQQKAIISRLSTKFGGSEDQVKSDIQVKGLPILEENIDVVSIPGRYIF